MSEKAQNQHNESRQLKPGQLLKQARERLGLEKKDIASQLNLQVDTIEAVENDAAEKLPAPTYVRGYIRSYARMVHLNGDELIRLYENDAAGPPEIIPDIRQHHQATSQDKPVKTVTYLITLCLALLLIAWLQSHYVVTKPVPAEKPVTGTSEEIIVEDSGMKLSHQVYYYPDVDLTEYGVPATNLPEYTEQEPAASASPSPSDKSITDDVMNNGGMESAFRIDPAIDIAAGSAAIGTTEDRIRFTVNRDSWIEVYGSGNNRLYIGMGKAGEEINISGIGPFNVLLGYSPGVSVSFNGNKFDPEPFSKGGVAKFTLGKTENQEAAE
jgi:cytoskeleton protein RodZ